MFVVVQKIFDKGFFVLCRIIIIAKTVPAYIHTLSNDFTKKDFSVSNVISAEAVIPSDSKQ